MNLTWILLSLMTVQTQARADQVLKNSNLESILRSAWQSSPSLQGQKEQADLANGDRYRRFIFNEPQFQVLSSDDHSAMSYGISLPTAFPGKTMAFMDIDKARAHAASAEFDAKKYELAKLVTQSFLDCASVKAALKVQTVTSNDLETLFNSLKAIYESGRSTQAEKIGAELQARQAKLDLVTLVDRERVLCKKLDATLSKAGVDFSSTSLTDTSLPEDIDSSLLKDLGLVTADQARSEAGIELADANRSVAWWSQVPDLTLGITRSHYLYLPASPSGKEWATTFSVGITVPLLFPFHETIEASRAKSQAMIDRNTAEIQKVQADSDRMDGASEYQRSLKRLKEIREKDLPLAEALVESTYSAYQTGKLGYAELVLSRRTLSDIQNQDIQLRVSVITAHLRCLNQCEDL
jgi:outer membrane protein TolC